MNNTQNLNIEIGSASVFYEQIDGTLTSKIQCLTTASTDPVNVPMTLGVTVTTTQNSFGITSSEI